MSAMVDEARLPADPAQLQERLWAQADVLPGLSETLLQLAKTQETGVSDLGFVAKGPIAKGDVIISVPMRFALVVNMKSGAKGDELPSDVRLALQLLRVLDLTDAGEAEFDDDVKAFWRAYTLRILPRETFAAIAWEEADIEQMQYERTVEEVKALRSRLEELCKQTLEETEQFEEDEEDEEDEDTEPVPGKRKVTISSMQAVRLPGGKTMMEDATLRWALSIVRSRSFMLDENDDSPVLRRAIVPVADLFNHQPEGPLMWASMDEELTNPWQVLRGDDGMLYVDICAHRDYTKGEEVLLPYGLETSADLLCSHGIVLAENAADYVPVYSDAVELVGDIVELELEQDTAVAQAKLNLIQEADAAEAPLSIRPGDITRSGHLLSCLQVAYAEPGELDAFEDAFDEFVGHFTLQPIGLSTERCAELKKRALIKAISLCDEELSRMPSALSEDLSQLTQLLGQGVID